MSKRLIYEEDAIEAVRIFYADECALVDSIEEQLEKLPSAQPEQPTGVQDILQYLDEYLHPIVSPEHWSVYSELYDMVSMLPSAQPQRIKGRWVRKESDLSWWYECSECGESPLFDPYEHEVRTPFCPWCGAEMRGEDDADD